MYTQCPDCQTIFEISAEHLKAANGDVRCGQCLNVFSALDNLSEDIPNSTPETAEEEYLPEDIFASDEHATNEQASADHAGEISETGVQDTDETLVERVAAVTYPLSAPASEKDEDLGLSEFFSDVIDDSPEYTEVDYETRLKKQQPLSPDGGFFYGGANEAIIEKILNEHEPEERELDEFTLPSEPATSEGQNNPAKGKKDISKDVSANIPPQLLEDLESGHFSEAKASSKFWLTGSVLLMLMFVLQAIYFSRHDLARNPAYRPLLAQACEMIGCKINVTYDIKKIEIIGRDVRSHPTAQHALIAGTTLINNAKFPQPYPLLTLTFSDITGTMLAQRRFTPREYLKTGTDIRAGMTPDSPVQVELELVDPGKDAVNFEFHAETDPRAVTPARG